jgi:hypothetical protein
MAPVLAIAGMMARAVIATAPFAPLESSWWLGHKFLRVSNLANFRLVERSLVRTALYWAL